MRDYSHYTEWPTIQKNFWDVPKCGTTSIKHALLLSTKRADVRVDIGYAQTYRYTHAWVHSLSNSDYITREEALSNGYENFAMVRNPYSRFISAFKDVKRRTPAYFALADETETIYDVFEQIEPLTNAERDCHFRTQAHFIYDDGIVVDKLFKIEDIDSISKYLNLKLPVLNSTNSHVDITEDIVKRIYNLYKEDFEILNYGISGSKYIN